MGSNLILSKNEKIDFSLKIILKLKFKNKLHN